MINPSQIIQQTLNNSQLMQNPRARKVLEAYQRKDHDALVQIGNNIFKENGTTLDEATKRFMQMNHIN